MSWTVIRPSGARILVRLDAKRSHYGAIVIPELYQKQPETGRVVAVGPQAGDGWKAATWDGAKWVGGTRVFFGKWNGQPCESPTFDSEGEYWFLRAPLLSDKGAKLPVPNQGHTRLPVIDEVFAIIDDEGMSDDEVVTMTARDLPKAAYVK